MILRDSMLPTSRVLNRVICRLTMNYTYIAGIYYLAVYMLGFGFCIGLHVMITHRNGEKKYKETGKTFFQDLLFLIVFWSVMGSEREGEKMFSLAIYLTAEYVFVILYFMRNGD